MSNQKVVLITGASSGIGRAMARYLAEKRYTVLGTSRDPTACESIPGVQLLELEVCSDESVKACVDAVLAQYGRLDVLINNAGYMLVGAIEEVTMEEAKSHFEVTLFGAMRTVKAVLPIMREQGGGQIINISALGGIVPTPFMGVQAPAKFAIEGYTETLRYEVKSFNIRVSLVQLGPFKTNLFKNRQHTANTLRLYDSVRQRADAFLAQINKASDPERAAELILKIIESKSPKVRYGAGKASTLIPLLRRFLPARLFEANLRKIYGLGSKES